MIFQVPLSEGGIESFAYCASIVWDLLANEVETKSLIDKFWSLFLTSL